MSLLSAAALIEQLVWAFRCGGLVMLRVRLRRVGLCAWCCRANVGMRVRMDVDGAIVIGSVGGTMVDEDGVASPAESCAVPPKTPKAGAITTAGPNRMLRS